eukprot:m.91746 g.91746  ORF g.91746 m.91746 type:complete len:110 (+) comp16510_c0_seq2:201-530(+)
MYSKQGLNIVAMPSTQFNQEHKTNSGVAEFVTSKGVEFTVLGLGDVNGANEHPLYTALKERSSQKDIRWNFATYFLIDKKGEVTRHDGVSPMELEEKIGALLSQESCAL